MPKKPITKSFPPADDILRKQGARPASEVLQSPTTNKSKPKIK